MGFQVGLSIPRDHGFSINFGAGFESKRRFVDQNTAVESIEAAPSVGFWVDRHNALLFGATFDQATNRRVSLNLFPGVVDVAGIPIGAWVVVDSEGRPYFGFSGSRTLGLGVGWGL